MKTNNLAINERYSNFELLMIISMILIVAGHFFRQSGLIFDTSGINQIYCFLFGSAPRIAVNIFLILGCWFMVDSGLKAKRILNLYIELWLYNFTISCFMLLFTNVPLSQYTWVKAVTPYIHKTLWFATAYLFLMFLSPFLRKFFDMETKIQSVILFFMTISIPVYSTIHSYSDSIFDAFLWFIYIFLLTGFYKHKIHSKIFVNKYLFLFAGLLIYFLMASVRYIAYYLQNTSQISLYLYDLMTRFLADYKTFPNLICSFFIFYFFSKLNIRVNKVINYFAKSAFAVYIIHQVPCFHDYLWHNICRCDVLAKSEHFIIYTVLTVFLIYIICTLIDTLRNQICDKFIIKSRPYIIAENFINNLYNNNNNGAGQ